MTRRAGRVGRGAAALVAGVLATVGLASSATLAAATSAAATTHDELGVRILLDEVSPQVLTPGEDLVIRATLENTGDSALLEPRVLVHLDRSSFISRSSLDRWRDAGPQGAVGSAILSSDLEEPLGPGESVNVTLTVPATAVGLRTGVVSWGPRGAAVQVVDLDDPARATAGLTRTFVLWYPVEEVTPTRVSVLVPLVGPPADGTTDSWSAELAELTGPQGRLADVLAATADHPHASWVVDPWLVDAATGEVDTADEAADVDQTADQDETAGDGEATGQEETADDGPPGEEAVTPATQAWVEELLAATAGRDVQLLPYTDLDLTALARADAGELLEAGRDRSAERARAGGLAAETGSALAWPAETLPDLTTAALVAGSSAVVVGPGSLPVPGVLTYTPTGRTVVSTAAGDAAVLVPDARLSTALRTGGAATYTVSDRGVQDDEDSEAGARTTASARLTPAAAAQDLLAELAVITRERPSDSRHLLVTVPRDWAPDPEVAAAQLAALEAAPWVQTADVQALLDAPDPGVDRGTLPDSSAGAAGATATTVTADDLDRVRDALEEREALAGMVEDPSTVLGDAELEMLAVGSVAWRADPGGRQAMIDRSVAVADGLRAAVGVLQGSDVNLISTTGELPVRVANDLDQAVTVQVALRPGDARLRADGAVEVTIPGQAEATVAVPVHGIQSADVAVGIELRTPDGALVDDSTVMTVRVRAEWEGIGTAVLGGLLAVGIVIGVARTIRRGRMETRAAPQTASGPDDLSPEDLSPEGTTERVP